MLVIMEFIGIYRKFCLVVIMFLFVLTRNGSRFQVKIDLAYAKCTNIRDLRMLAHPLRILDVCVSFLNVFPSQFHFLSILLISQSKSSTFSLSFSLSSSQSSSNWNNTSMKSILEMKLTPLNDEDNNKHFSPKKKIIALPTLFLWQRLGMSFVFYGVDKAVWCGNFGAFCQFFISKKLFYKMKKFKKIENSFLDQVRI